MGHAWRTWTITLYLHSDHLSYSLIPFLVHLLFPLIIGPSLIVARTIVCTVLKPSQYTGNGISVLLPLVVRLAQKNSTKYLHLEPTAFLNNRRPLDPCCLSCIPLCVQSSAPITADQHAQNNLLPAVDDPKSIIRARNAERRRAAANHNIHPATPCNPATALSALPGRFSHLQFAGPSTLPKPVFYPVTPSPVQQSVLAPVPELGLPPFSLPPLPVPLPPLEFSFLNLPSPTLSPTKRLSPLLPLLPLSTPPLPPLCTSPSPPLSPLSYLTLSPLSAAAVPLFLSPVPLPPPLSPVMSAATGIGAMPGPRSKDAPHFLFNSINELNDFLFEFEELAKTHKVTSGNHIHAALRYADHESKQLWRTADGYNTDISKCDWDKFKKKLTNNFYALRKRKYTLRELQDITRSGGSVASTAKPTSTSTTASLRPSLGR